MRGRLIWKTLCVGVVCIIGILGFVLRGVIIEEYWIYMLKTGGWDMAARSVARLAELRCSRAVVEIGRALKEGRVDLLAGEDAIKEIALRNRCAVSSLLVLVEIDDDWVQIVALDALRLVYKVGDVGVGDGRFLRPENRVMDAVCSIVQSIEEDEDVRVAAIDVFFSLSSDAEFMMCLRVAYEHGVMQGGVRRFAADLMGVQKVKGSASLLRQWLRDAVSSEAWFYARALSEVIPDEPGVSRIIVERAVSGVLRRGGEEVDKGLLRECAAALKQVGSSCIPAVRGAFAASSAEGKLWLIQVLRSLGEEGRDGLDVLLAGEVDESREVRCEAQQALADLGIEVSE